jgi:hypothetical protein
MTPFAVVPGLLGQMTRYAKPGQDNQMTRCAKPGQDKPSPRSQGE